jgi:acetyl-CoA decarbonylase/synthase complex subunit gamma
MSYLVPPGLYALGNPGPDDTVVVTANYKMSYDIVRRELRGRNIWLVVLETYGINVWCAAGKGTFGTGEIVRRVEATGLANVVDHRLLILPILGAPGVSAHAVKARTGFRVRYATIRASDLPEFLDNGMKTHPRMRELTFNAYERLVLTPIELTAAVRKSIPLFVLLFLAGAFASGSFSPADGVFPVFAYSGALLAGAVVTPVLLPWLPTRSFCVKGAVIGLLWALLFYVVKGGEWNGFQVLANFFLLPIVTSFLALNFTGSTPFTSPSGVRKEMRLSLPVMAVALIAGLVFLVMGKMIE